jgi:hypothetical protein
MDLSAIITEHCCGGGVSSGACTAVEEVPTQVHLPDAQLGRGTGKRVSLVT